uniref:13.9 kDa salivary protein n=1 Tax=Phlebotomus duboscqi TaxID=37738 RepID=Q06K59_PHLDU|nr:13.9 kDa salivary protein [Phlebotomus duboscqi]
MKYFVVFFISAVFLIGICDAAHPFEKCKEDSKAGKFGEECILHCQYKIYGFTNKKYEISSYHIEKFYKVLSKGNIVQKNDKNKLRKLLKDCADQAERDPTSKDCRKINNYYRCIVNNDLVSYNKYAEIIIAHDKTFNV